MSNYEKHIGIAKHNKECAKDIRKAFPSKYNDWIVTVRFYESIHLVEAMIASNNGLKDPTGCEVRYPEKPQALVSVKNIKDSADLKNAYAKNGHDLRSCVIKDNLDFFGKVGNACLFLRRLSQSARYDCQSITDEESIQADKKLFDAEAFFNGRAINLNLETI